MISLQNQHPVVADWPEPEENYKCIYVITQFGTIAFVGSGKYDTIRRNNGRAESGTRTATAKQKKIGNMKINLGVSGIRIKFSPNMVSNRCDDGGGEGNRHKIRKFVVLSCFGKNLKFDIRCTAVSDVRVSWYEMGLGGFVACRFMRSLKSFEH